MKKILPELVSDCDSIFYSLSEKYSKEELRLLIKSYNAHFPNYMPITVLPGSQLIVYRRYKRNLIDDLNVTLNDSVKFSLLPDSYFDFDLPVDSEPFHFNLSNGNTLEVWPNDSEESRYIKCSFDKKLNQYSLKLTSVEEGEFDIYKIDLNQKKKNDISTE